MTPFRTRIEHVDTDATGIVHFSRYASLLETAGLDDLETAGVGLAAFEAAGVDLVAVELRLRYRASAVYRDVVTGRSRVDHVGAAWFRIAVTLSREDGDGTAEPLVAGTLSFAAVDRGSRRPAALPSSLRTTLKGLTSNDEHHAHSSSGTAD
ncbi:acyl-CoA thioesterase [Lentzea sp. CA-135723]|uniref:acyl-CoA thioesterase n=1 Tax=Lentzea sp. CA-135723 TaxID=3239950 RepID=UPI003D8A258A